MKRFLSVLMGLLVCLVVHGKTEAALVIHYDFDDVDGPYIYGSELYYNIFNQAANANHLGPRISLPLAAGDDAWGRVDGVIGKAIHLKRNPSIMLDFTVDGDPDFTGWSQLALKAWVKPETFAGEPDVSAIVLGGGGINLYMNASGYVYAFLWAYPYPTIIASTPLSLNCWSHIAVTYDGSSVKLYINGSVSATGAATGTLVSSQGVWGHRLSVGGQTYYHYDSLHPGAERRFKGAIDEVEIYDAALSGLEIATNYLEGASPGALAAFQAKISALETALEEGVAECEEDLAAAESALGECGIALAASETALGECNSNLSTCQGDLAAANTCNADLNSSAAALGLAVDGCDIQGTNAYVAPGQLQAQRGLPKNSNAVKVIVP